MHRFFNIRLILLSLLIVALSAGCAPAAAPTPAPTSGPVTLSDGNQRSVTLTLPVQRIVSLAPSNTEILYAIGAGAQVVGRDSFSDFPEAAQALPDVGGGFGELNMEIIIAQNPDLVMASALTPPEQIQALEAVGLTVFVLGNPTDFDGLYANLELAARLTGHEAESAALVESLKARVDAVTGKLAGITEKPLVFYELDGTDPSAPWTPGPGTFIDMLINMAGGRNLGGQLEGEWVQISLEALIAQNPDLILLGDTTWGGVTPEDVAARAGWNAMDAVNNGNLLPFDDNLVSRPGPRLVDGLEQLAQLFHPDLFK